LYDYLSYNIDSRRIIDLIVVDGVMSGDLIVLFLGEVVEIVIGV
jgi:hypothetical protein